MSCADQISEFKTHLLEEDEYGRGISANDLRVFLNKGDALQSDIGSIPQSNLSLREIQNSFLNYNYLPATDEQYYAGYFVSATNSTTILSNWPDQGSSVYSLITGWYLYFNFRGIISSAIISSASFDGTYTKFVLESSIPSSQFVQLPLYLSRSGFLGEPSFVNYRGSYRYENKLPVININGSQTMTVSAGYAGTTGIYIYENGVTKRAQYFKPIWYPPSQSVRDGELPFAARAGHQYGTPMWMYGDYTWLAERAFANSLFVDDSGNGTSGRILYTQNLNYAGGTTGSNMIYRWGLWNNQSNIIALNGSWQRDGNHLKLLIPEIGGFFGFLFGDGYADYFMPMCADDWNGAQINSGCSVRLDNFYSNPKGTFMFANADQYAYINGVSGSDGVNGRGYAPFGQWPFKLVETDSHGYPIDAPCPWFDDIRGIGCAASSYFQDPGATAVDPEEGDITHKIRVVIRYNSLTGPIIEIRGYHLYQGTYYYVDPNTGLKEPPAGYAHSNPYETAIDLNIPGTYYIIYEINDHCYYDNVQNGNQIISAVRTVNVV